MRLVTPQEVVERAFTNSESFDYALLKDYIIEATQLRWLLPVLGGDLWDELVTEGDAGSYSATNQILVDKLISPMAFFVKYELIPDMSINQTDAGLQVINTEYSTAATDSQRGKIQDQALTHAQTHLKEVVRWLEDEDNIGDYPLYYAAKNTKNKSKRRGGLIL